MEKTFHQNVAFLFRVNNAGTKNNVFIFANNQSY